MGIFAIDFVFVNCNKIIIFCNNIANIKMKMTLFK